MRGEGDVLIGSAYVFFVDSIDVCVVIGGEGVFSVGRIEVFVGFLVVASVFGGSCGVCCVFFAEGSEACVVWCSFDGVERLRRLGQRSAVEVAGGSGFG